MSVVAVVALAGLALSGVLAVVRVIREGSLADRLLGADFLLTVIAIGVIVVAGERSTGRYLDLAVVVAILGFVATITVARYIERRGAR